MLEEGGWGLEYRVTTPSGTVIYHVERCERGAEVGVVCSATIEDLEGYRAAAAACRYLEPH